MTTSVSDVLSGKSTPHVPSVQSSATVLDAVKRMHKYQVGCLVVSEGEGTVAGIVSEQDIFRQLAALEGDVSETLVRDVMTTDVLVCGPADHIDTARSIMKTHRIHQVPVVDNEGTLLGIVSIDDVNAHLITEHAVEINYLHDYIEGRVR